MSLALLRRTLRAQAVKLLLVALALAAWGSLMPVIYAEFGGQFRQLFESGVVPRQFASFGGGNIFSLAGSIALGLIHPIAVALVSVFAVGFAAASVAGERQRGTLEVLLARPISRRSVLLTVLVATLLFVAATVGALIAGSVAGSLAWGVVDELPAHNVPALWLNGTLLFTALASIALAASVSFDRLTPALGIALAVLIVAYFLQVLGSLWPDAEPLQPYSLFHYLQPAEVLESGARWFDMALLALVSLAAIGYALIAFPRRDIAAPS